MHSPILVIDLFFFLFFLSVLIIIFSNSYPKKAFPNPIDFWKLAGWFLFANSYLLVEIENGKIISDAPLSNHRKVVIIDPASAAAVIYPNKELQILKSGFYCLNAQTSLYAIFDLRTQSALFPLDTSGSVSPEIQSSSATDDPAPINTYMHATTQDGYQVGAAFWVTFKYAIEFGAGGNPYGFDSAILIKTLAKLPTNFRSMLDPQLQSRVLIQQSLQSLWQNKISHIELLDLIPQNKDQPSRLEQIEKDLRKTLTSNNLSQSDDQTNNATGNGEKEMRLLQEQGLLVLNLYLHSFWLPPETDLAIQHHWQPYTHQITDAMQYFNEQRSVIYQELGEMHALYTYFNKPGEMRK